MHGIFLGIREIPGKFLEKPDRGKVLVRHRFLTFWLSVFYCDIFTLDKKP